MIEQYQVDVYYLMLLGKIQHGPFFSRHDARAAQLRLNPYTSDPKSGLRIVKTTMTLTTEDEHTS